MRIEDKGLLREFGLKKRCEFCHQPPRRGTLLDAHHLFARGMGGGGRLDIRVNLVALCRSCHTDTHAGHIIRAALLAIVAQREGVMQDDIVTEIARLRRADRL
jgi:HNH endonuclease